MDDLISAVGSCVQRAQAAIEQAAVDQYMEYFEQPVLSRGMPDEDEPDGMLKPRTLDVALPGEEGEDRTVQVPLVALVNHNTLRLDQVKVKMNIIPTTLGQGQVEIEAAPPGKEGHSVELVFQADGVNEAVARISSAANQML